jgi:hypothetical protein
LTKQAAFVNVKELTAEGKKFLSAKVQSKFIAKGSMNRIFSMTFDKDDFEKSDVSSLTPEDINECDKWK